MVKAAFPALIAVALTALTVVAFGNVTVKLLILAVPVDAPKLRVVATPKALTLVATVLNTSRAEESVSTEVVKVGDVPKTTTPEPVSSVKVFESIADVPE